jgi:hypothetical protein
MVSQWFANASTARKPTSGSLPSRDEWARDEARIFTRCAVNSTAISDQRPQQPLSSGVPEQVLLESQRKVASSDRLATIHPMLPPKVSHRLRKYGLIKCVRSHTGIMQHDRRAVSHANFIASKSGNINTLRKSVVGVRIG